MILQINLIISKIIFEYSTINMIANNSEPKTMPVGILSPPKLIMSLRMF